MNKKHIALIVVMVLLSIVLVIGGTYAFYIATITGNNTAEEITITSGYLELTFAEDNNITMENVLPGNKDDKTFTVTNTSTADVEFTYNIKLAEVETTFEQEDLVYTLEEYKDGTYETPKESGTTATGYINKNTINEEGEMYLAINIPAPSKGEKQYYKLTIEFKETNKNQDYNKGKSFTGKINGDDNRDAALYVPPKTKSFSEIIKVDNTNIFADEAENIRYAGPSAEVNNYIWFNCDDYDFTSAEDALSKNCEKWRIIGLFKNITKTAGGEENLVKIIRAESIGEYSWDNKGEFGVNDWSTAELMYLLNPNYSDHQLKSETANNSLYWESKSGKCSTSDLGSTTECNFTSTGLKGNDDGPTKSMIESVKWNIGGASSIGDNLSAFEYYTAERGETVYGDIPTTWNGYIGLMYPSDYLYATSGNSNGTYNRNQCLTGEHGWYSYFGSDYSDCYNNDWLFNENTMWTLTPGSEDSDGAHYVLGSGGILNVGVNTHSPKNIHPSLYLKSSVGVLDDGISDGSEEKPYILIP